MYKQSVWLEPLQDDDREQFILDNQEAFLCGATQEFDMRDNHFEVDNRFPDGILRFEKRTDQTST